MRLTTWENGERDRPLKVYAPCECGCSPDWYISASNDAGYGFTITLRDEEAALILARTPLAAPIGERE